MARDMTGSSCRGRHPNSSYDKRDFSGRVIANPRNKTHGGVVSTKRSDCHRDWFPTSSTSQPAMTERTLLVALMAGTSLVTMYAAIGLRPPLCSLYLRTIICKIELLQIWISTT
jgi:hypothetical protein